MIARQASEDVREILVASTGRARRSKWSGDVPTPQSRAFVCSKHVLSDEACWPISERCLSNRLILPQQPHSSQKNTEVTYSLCMLSVLKVDIYVYVSVQTETKRYAKVICIQTYSVRMLKLNQTVAFNPKKSGQSKSSRLIKLMATLT